MRAAAGSGKTRVLVSRFMRLIELGAPGDSILVITFTRKAAQEMKERIVRALLEQGMRREAQEAETGPIQTVHSFCERLLRENALEAGLDPEFELLDPVSSASRFRDAFRTAMTQALNEGGPAAGLIARQGLHTAYRAPTEGAADLGQAVDSVIEHSRHRLETPESLRALGVNPPLLRQRLLEFGLAHAGFEAGQVPLDLEGQQALVEELRKWGKSRRRRLPKWASLWSPSSFAEEASDTSALCSLAADAWELLEEGHMRDQAFSFSMLESLSLRLLLGSRAVQERISRSLSAVLVDESQDLNPVQHAIIGSLGVSRMMMVGDPQQSIYGFRHADRRLFTARCEEWPTLPLSRNFRSRDGILRFVDWLFRQRWGAEYQPMAPPEEAPGFGAELPYGDWTGVEIWDPPHDHGRFGFIADRLQACLDEGVRPQDAAILASSAKNLASLAESLSARRIPHQIQGETARYYARMEVRDVANALRAVCDPSDGHAWQAFLLSPFAGLSLDSVILLFSRPFNPDDLDSFEPPLEEDRERLDLLLQWLPNARAMADRWTAWELLSELLARSPLLTSLARRPAGREMIANVRQLLVIASRFSDKGPLEFAEDIRETQRFRQRAEEAKAYDREDGLVTLMTYHSSKGLEFPFVIVDAPDKAPPKGSLAAARGCSAPAYAARSTRGPAWTMLRDAAQEEEGEERERVFYVAYTRAQERLCVVAGQNHPHNTPLQRIIQLKEPPSGLVIRKQAARSEEG